MDPSANLKEQRELAKAIVDADGLVEVSDLATDGVRLAELVIALDEWITRGGALPSRWESTKKE